MEASRVNKEDDSIERKIQANITQWQAVENPLAPLTEEQMDVIYHVGDAMNNLYHKRETQTLNKEPDGQVIDTYNKYVNWMVRVENEAKREGFNGYFQYFHRLNGHSKECKDLFDITEDVINGLGDLRDKYQQVTKKTDSLHILSEELMRHQKELKDKKRSIQEKLHYFTLYQPLYEAIMTGSVNVNSAEFRNMLDQIDASLMYLNEHKNFKESYSYGIKYTHLLVIALQNVLKYVNQVVTDATHQVISLDNKSLLNLDKSGNEPSINSAFSFYYGKFQNAASKISAITNHIEEKMDKYDAYNKTLLDCQRVYFSQRSPMMTAAISKALCDLREKYKHDHSILFRSSGLFVIKVCQDESTCYRHFFSKSSPQLEEYLGTLCQNLYDILRPSLISINHLEVLTEICTILKEMLNDQVQNNVSLDQFVETVKQLVQDVEERLVFRTNVFFQHDLLKYEPSPGDLAYPEKLEQMENIAVEISERRPESRSSVVSAESQEVMHINTNYVGQFRSYTGNSPADLHGMWYPTVKRTLVCLSRIYFCLDREIFQGLAQEALIICVKTIDGAAEKISSRKSILDGKLFQIKHLLIIREQIAPFQVDFTVKEMSLDFSMMKTAAIELVQKRDKLFTFSTNNAILEFLLEGTPRVKEYLVDSRKEIDKQLKATCEAFIMSATSLLVGNVVEWIQRAEQVLKIIRNTGDQKSVSLREQEFARPQNVASIVTLAQRNIKSKVPEVQRSMKLYLANKETEFILFRPIKNNVLNVFMQVEQILASAKYTQEDQIMIGCPTTDQLNVLICSVSLTTEQEHAGNPRNVHSRHSDVR